MRCSVTGAGGFIGGHLVKRLLDGGHDVCASDVKPTSEWHQLHSGAENLGGLDCSDPDEARDAVGGAEWVFALAADMGGMGFIENNKAACMLSVLTSTNTLIAARDAEVSRYFYASSACVYPGHRQSYSDSPALMEEDAYPADPEDGYGWEKLFSERMCRHFAEDFGMTTRAARYHNVYGPAGTYDGGREKAPAAIARKVLEAKASGDLAIEVWGDGEQTRSFMYVDDCVEGTLRLMTSDHRDALNIGSDRLVSINDLVSIAERVVFGESGVLERRYDLSAPQGVRGRNSDNRRCREVLGWEPSVSLEDGMRRLIEWMAPLVDGRPRRT